MPDRTRKHDEATDGVGQGVSNTNWARLDAMSDDEAEAAAAADPDAPPLPEGRKMHPMAKSKRFRIKHGVSQEQFAERSGFSQQYISDLERGRRNPTIVSLFELAQALDAAPVELLATEGKSLS